MSEQQLHQELETLRRTVANLQLEQERARTAINLLVQMIEALRYASLSLTAEMPLESVLEQVLGLSFRLLPSDVARIYMYDGKELHLGANIREGVPDTQEPPRPRKHGLTYTVAVTGERVVIPNTDTHPLYQDQRLQGDFAKALVGIPLRIGKKIVGVMLLGFKESRDFNEQDLDLLDLFAMQAAIAIENARLYKTSEALREQDRAFYEELNHTKDLVVNMVSHDLKNPIGMIKGYVYLLRTHSSLKDTQDPMIQDALYYIEQGAENMLNLVTDLLDLAKIETGLAIQPVWTTMGAVVRPALDTLVYHAQQKNIDLRVDYPSDELPIFADAARLSQVLTNLLSNGIKYTPQGGRVTLRGRLYADSLTFEIEDSGEGIPSEELPRLFEKFYRLKSHAHLEGTGLGLAIVKAIVEGHEGQIEVESEIGKGTRFLLYLPQPLPETH